MLRPLVSAACIAGTLLAMLLWVRSYWATDGVAFLFFRRGGVVQDRHFYLNTTRGDLVLRILAVDAAPVVDEPPSAEWRRQLSIGGAPLQEPATDQGWQAFGFQSLVERRTLPSQGSRVDRWISVPLGFVVLAFGAYPALRARSILRHRRIAKLLQSGLCVRCGYDLRSSPGQCPECGAKRGA
jgi:hypothetical protein